jgi:hypothetical protein
MAFDPSIITRWREALGGRRYLMCMGASLVNTLLFAFGILSEMGYLVIFHATVGAYLVARHAEAKNGSP